MRVLTDRETQSNTLQEVRRLPESVLNAIASSGGIGRGPLTRLVARSLPKGVETSQVVEWVETILSYLIVRGDVERGAGATYFSLPPYAVGLLAHDASQARYVRLHGDARGDKRLLRRLNTLDPTARISHRQEGVRADSEDRGSDAETIAEGDEGIPEPDLTLIDRTLCLSAYVIATAVRRTGKDHGRMRVQALLPRGSCLRSPLHTRSALPPGARLEGCGRNGGRLGGVRALGRRERSRGCRYEPWQDWEHPLVRKRGRGHETEEVSRSFYHAGGGMVSELDPDGAALWLHHLNWLEGHPDSAVYHGGTLYVPNNFPLHGALARVGAGSSPASYSQTETSGAIARDRTVRPARPGGEAGREGARSLPPARRPNSRYERGRGYGGYGR